VPERARPLRHAAGRVPGVSAASGTRPINVPHRMPGTCLTLRRVVGHHEPMRLPFAGLLLM